MSNKKYATAEKIKEILNLEHVKNVSISRQEKTTLLSYWGGVDMSPDNENTILFTHTISFGNMGYDEDIGEIAKSQLMEIYDEQ